MAALSPPHPRSSEAALVGEVPCSAQGPAPSPTQPWLRVTQVRHGAAPSRPLRPPHGALTTWLSPAWVKGTEWGKPGPIWGWRETGDLWGPWWQAPGTPEGRPGQEEGDRLGTNEVDQRDR